MFRLAWRSAKGLARALLYGLVGGFLVLVLVLVLHLNSRPDLRAWHEVELDAEFTADAPVSSFADYLALEDRLFRELEAELLDRIGPDGRDPVNRFHRGSLSDPARWPRNWNRSFELPVESPRLGALLLHGMSDSPYSMRSLGQRLHGEGAWVLGLRLPGHGTAPAGLLSVRWQDMAAAVRLAARHVQERVGDHPLVVIGYSNGGALAVEYGLEALERSELPRPDRLVLLSPQIGITRLAALAVWQQRLGSVLGLEKLAWNTILPEYDPFKYVSFALNAGRQSHLITREIQSRLAALRDRGELHRFPRTLAFQSVVDATVSAPALVTGLFDPLPKGGHELVLFDINRVTEIEAILRRSPDAWLRDILADAEKSFTVSVVTNESEETPDVVVHQRRPDDARTSRTALGLRWPAGLFSLSHVALPFPPDDPLYGGPEAGKSPGIPLGRLALRGERGVLQVAPAAMLRLHWNPFHAYVEERLLELVAELEAVPRRTVSAAPQTGASPRRLPDPAPGGSMSP